MRLDYKHDLEEGGFNLKYGYLENGSLKSRNRYLEFNLKMGS